MKYTFNAFQYNQFMGSYYLQFQIVARLGGDDEHRVPRHAHDALDLSLVLPKDMGVELMSSVRSDEQVL